MVDIIYSGYQLKQGSKLDCEPGPALKAKLICEKTCINGVCTTDNRCECNDNFELKNSVCTEKCSLVCKSGVCDNETCLCDLGYSLSQEDATVCKPLCDPSCFNGKCIKPNECACDEG